MGRKLYVRQKKILDAWYRKHKHTLGLGFRVETSTKFPYSLLRKLEQINDHEMITQNINRYITDKVAEDMYRR